jgi:hypothetical protein
MQDGMVGTSLMRLACRTTLMEVMHRSLSLPCVIKALDSSVVLREMPYMAT